MKFYDTLKNLLKNLKIFERNRKILRIFYYQRLKSKESVTLRLVHQNAMFIIIRKNKAKIKC